MANSPRLLREMLSRLFSRSSSINVIGEVTKTNNLPLVVGQLHPDWVVVTLGSNGSFPWIVNRIMEKEPHIGVIAVSEDGDQARARIKSETYDSLALSDLINLLGEQAHTQKNESAGSNGAHALSQ